MSRTQIGSERAGYGRGLILGLTMAETMLLLVFCLLLAVGAIIANKDKETKEALAAREEAETALAEALDELSALDEKLEVLLASTGNAVIDEEWRELRAARQTARKVEASGMTVEELVQNASLGQAARENGLKVETVASVVQAAKTGEILHQHGYKTPEAAAELVSIIEAKKNENTDKGPHAWPPIINLSETEGQSFASGSADLTDSFKRRLASVAPVIADRIRSYDVEIVEVIGHTDEEAMSRSGSNMDRRMRDVIDGKAPIGTLSPADNAGLGLARALSVVTYLRDLPALSGLADVSFIPMSGGQIVMPGDLVSDGSNMGNDPARRRIEIRVRKRISGGSQVQPTELPLGIDAQSVPFFDAIGRVLTALPD